MNFVLKLLNFVLQSQTQAIGGGEEGKCPGYETHLSVSAGWEEVQSLDQCGCCVKTGEESRTEVFISLALTQLFILQAT